MLVPLHEVPPYERHLLFCTDLTPSRPSRWPTQAAGDPISRPAAELDDEADQPQLIAFAAGFDAAGMTLGVA